MSTHNDAVADALIAEVAQLRAERDALRQQQADDAESLAAAVNTIRELRSERDAIAGRHELALTTGAELREERAALIRERNLAWTQLADARVLLREARAALPDMKYCARLCYAIDAALAKDKP